MFPWVIVIPVLPFGIFTNVVNSESEKKHTGKSRHAIKGLEGKLRYNSAIIILK